MLDKVQKDKYRPLVSVIVITYNSGKTVLETLESIKNQTYQNIELVITDDCSKDNTCELVNVWLSENASYFTNTAVVFSEVNTGVAENDNRGVTASSGMYIKALAGDDCLRADAIERFVTFMEAYNLDFCVSNLQLFSDLGTVPESKIQSYQRCFELCKENREEKLKRLAYEYILLSPGYFYKREVFDKVGGYDKRFPMSEEVPFAMRVLKAGYDIVALEEKLVLYRYSGESLSQHHGKKLGNRKWFEDNRKIYYIYQLPELLKRFRWLKAYSKMVQYEQTNLAYQDGILPRIGGGILCLINPYTYYTIIRRVWGRFKELRRSLSTREKI